MIRIEQTGPLALVQDLGRPGLARLGVTTSGAADRAALRLANRLVGNPEGAAGLEVTLGGLVLRTDVPLWCAVTGPATGVEVEPGHESGGAESKVVGSHRSIALRPGDRLRVPTPDAGVRNYLAVRGGLLAPEALGSRATDVLSGLGPEPVRAGDTFAVGEPDGELPSTASVPPPEPADVLWLTAGPRADWFGPPGWRQLIEQSWQVSPDSNRVGVRLIGPRLERLAGFAGTELPSEALLPGAIQLPPSGQPLIFGRDHPVTGGYPVIAVLTEASCDAAAQLRAGSTIRLRPRR